MLDLSVKQILIQIAGFLVMFLVMKRYGWQPLLNILEARRKKIQEGFESIAAQKEEATKLTAQYEEKLREINAEARKKIQEAIAEGQKISIEIQNDAHASAKSILQKAKLEMAVEVTKAKNQLKNEMVNLVVHTTEMFLHKNLDEANQKKLIENFVEEAQLK